MAFTMPLQLLCLSKLQAEAQARSQAAKLTCVEPPWVLMLDPGCSMMSPVKEMFTPRSCLVPMGHVKLVNDTSTPPLHRSWPSPLRYLPAALQSASRASFESRPLRSLCTMCARVAGLGPLAACSPQGSCQPVSGPETEQRAALHLPLTAWADHRCITEAARTSSTR